MKIIFDYDIVDPEPERAHFIETTPGEYIQVVHPTLGAAPVDVMQLVKAFHVGTIPIAGTGWDEITKHPSYPGQTRLQALIGEIIRLNDAPARAILGI